MISDARVETKKRYQTPITPRFADFDLQGILNSSKYLELVGEARIDQMERCYKKPLSEYTALGQTFVISEFRIQYIRPIPFGTNFIIETEVVEVDGAKALIDFAFVSTEGTKTFASGKVLYHLFDLKARRPVPISDQDKGIFL